MVFQRAGSSLNVIDFPGLLKVVKDGEHSPYLYSGAALLEFAGSVQSGASSVVSRVWRRTVLQQQVHDFIHWPKPNAAESGVQTATACVDQRRIPMCICTVDQTFVLAKLFITV